MKRNSLALILLTLIFAVSGFSQTKDPIDVVNEFWILAVKNDFESAKQKINIALFNTEKLEQLKQTFQTISKNELKITKFEKQEIQSAKAFFVLKAKGKNEQEITAQIHLIKLLNTWQVMSLETFAEVFVEPDVFITQSLPIIEPEKQNNVEILPLKPYNPDDNSVKILAEPYNPNKNPAKYQYIIPKNP